MKKFFVLLTTLLLLGCGDRVTDAEDNTDDLLVGLWDSVHNDSTVCHKRLRLNSDRTFWWFADGKISAGSFGRGEDGLNFEYTDQPWEIMKFEVTDRELRIERMGVTSLYVRVPIAANHSPCTGGGKKPNQQPTRDPEGTVPWGNDYTRDQ